MILRTGVTTRPDFVILLLDLKAKHMEYDRAMEMAAEQLSELKGHLETTGFEKDSVKTTNFNVGTEYENQPDKQGNYRRVFTGFACSQQMKLSFDLDMERLTAALSAIAGCQANPELNIKFTVKEPEKISEELLREATANARRKAEILCEASDVKLGRLIAVDYNWGEMSVFSNTRVEFAEDLLSASPFAKNMMLKPDDIDVSDTATFVWEME